MVKPLDISRLEAGLESYLEARFLADGVTVPQPDGEAAVAQVAPAVIPGISLETVKVNAPAVAILANDAPADAPGLYGDWLRVQFVVVTPLLVPGIALEDHRALYDALLDAFPNRPRGTFRRRT